MSSLHLGYGKTYIEQKACILAARHSLQDSAGEESIDETNIFF